MLRMGDGPVANIPNGLDAYGGYTNWSGIGITYPQVVAKWPDAYHLSITTNGFGADCADVEPGAMVSWEGYIVGYCALSNVGPLIRKYGRPRKIWVAHWTEVAHICTPASCDPRGDYGLSLAGTVDGTQWTTHGNVWDESLLQDTFFDYKVSPPIPCPAPPPPPKPTPTIDDPQVDNMHKQLITLPTNASGNGWTPVPLNIDFNKVITATVNPNLQAGGTAGEAKVAVDGGGTYVEVSGCTPNAQIGVWIVVAD